MNISIYILKHPITNDIRYVGQTNNPKRRLSRHLGNSRTLKDKRHINNWIRSLNTLPIMEIIEVCDYSIRNEREQYWINYYKTKGYDLCNASNGGAGAGIGNTNCVGRKLSNSHKQRIRECNLGRKPINCKGGAPGKTIYQYDLNGNFINQYKSILSASKILHICRRTIKSSLNNKNLKTHRTLYKWSYEPLH